jgi:hypothetical protein
MSGFLRGFERFGAGLKRAFAPKNIERGFRDFGRVVERQALPVIQKIAGGIKTAAGIAAPVLLATGFGAPLAGLAGAISAGAGAAEQAIGKGRKVLKVAGEAVDAVQRPSLEKSARLGGKLAGAFA